MEILDSGERREFSTGAVRDVADEKGRCDLLPLDVAADLVTTETQDGSVLWAISKYIYSGDADYLVLALKKFGKQVGWDIPTMLLEASIHYSDGARKYSERNWEKGIPLHCYIDSGVRHYLKFVRGDNDEPHDRAFVWNLLGARWTQRHKPELIDLPFTEEF